MPAEKKRRGRPLLVATLGLTVVNCLSPVGTGTVGNLIVPPPCTQADAPACPSSTHCDSRSGECLPGEADAGSGSDGGVDGG